MAKPILTYDNGRVAGFSGTNDGEFIKWNSSPGEWVSTSSLVTSITGTEDQITASASTGAVSLSLPQDINTTSSPTFASIYTETFIANSGSFTFQGSGGSWSYISPPTESGAGTGLEINGGASSGGVGGDLILNGGNGTTDGSVKIGDSHTSSVIISAPLMLPLGDGTSASTSGIGFIVNVANGVDVGDLLYIDSDGTAKKAVNSGRKAQVIALQANVELTARERQVTSIRGSKVYVAITGAAPSFGNTLYLSATLGKATATIPTSGVLQSLGEIIGAAIGTTFPVIFEPRIIADSI